MASGHTRFRTKYDEEAWHLTASLLFLVKMISPA